MKVKVKFRDTEFGLFEPSFTVPVLGTGERFRGIYLDFVADGVPWSQLVLDQSIRRYQMLEETQSESPVFASATDGVYWIIERILDSERECGKEIEIEYEGEEMEEKTIEVPAGTNKVTLNIEREETPRAPTLRSMIEATAPDMKIRVRVKDSKFKWEFELPAEIETRAYYTPSELANCRSSRLRRLDSDLCDLNALLDERMVKVVAAWDHSVTFEVDVHV